MGKLLLISFLSIFSFSYLDLYAIAQGGDGTGGGANGPPGTGDDDDDGGNGSSPNCRGYWSFLSNDNNRFTNSAPDKKITKLARVSKSSAMLIYNKSREIRVLKIDTKKGCVSRDWNEDETDDIGSDGLPIPNSQLPPLNSVFMTTDTEGRAISTSLRGHLFIAYLHHNSGINYEIRIARINPVAGIVTTWATDGVLTINDSVGTLSAPLLYADITNLYLLYTSSNTTRLIFIKIPINDISNVETTAITTSGSEEIIIAPTIQNLPGAEVNFLVSWIRYSSGSTGSLELTRIKSDGTPHQNWPTAVNISNSVDIAALTKRTTYKITTNGLTSSIVASFESGGEIYIQYIEEKQNTVTQYPTIPERIEIGPAENIHASNVQPYFYTVGGSQFQGAFIWITYILNSGGTRSLIASHVNIQPQESRIMTQSMTLSNTGSPSQQRIFVDWTADLTDNRKSAFDLLATWIEEGISGGNIIRSKALKFEKEDNDTISLNESFSIVVSDAAGSNSNLISAKKTLTGYQDTSTKADKVVISWLDNRENQGFDLFGAKLTIKEPCLGEIPEPEVTLAYDKNLRGVTIDITPHPDTAHFRDKFEIERKLAKIVPGNNDDTTTFESTENRFVDQTIKEDTKYEYTAKTFIGECAGNPSTKKNVETPELFRPEIESAEIFTDGLTGAVSVVILTHNYSTLANTLYLEKSRLPDKHFTLLEKKDINEPDIIRIADTSPLEYYRARVGKTPAVGEEDFSSYSNVFQLPSTRSDSGEDSSDDENGNDNESGSPVDKIKNVFQSLSGGGSSGSDPFSGGCYLATSSSTSTNSHSVVAFNKFRSNYLLMNQNGTIAMKVYQNTAQSPSINVTNSQSLKSTLETLSPITNTPINSIFLLALIIFATTISRLCKKY